MTEKNQRDKKVLFDSLKQGIIHCDEEKVIDTAREIVDNGIDALKAVMEGLVPGMEYVGELYEKQEYFIPELLMCTEALYAGLDILKPHIKTPEHFKGVIVLGVVRGDVHDIGKNIVKVMFEVAGFKVYDLGRDVPTEKFLEEQVKTDADLLCLSALMTTTMTEMKEIISRAREFTPEARIMVGGAPLSTEIAEKYGADGFAKNAPTAVETAVRMLTLLKKVSSNNPSSSN